MSKLKNIFKDYIQAFSKKDINKLTTFFTKSATLVDWEINLKGKSNIISFNHQFFSSVSQIHINIIQLHQSQHTVIAEMNISIDHSPALHIVDVIDFDQENKISAIRAYKH